MRWVILLVPFLLACPARGANIAIAPDADNETARDLAVYKAVLDTTCIRLGTDGRRRLTVMDSTRTLDLERSVAELMDSVRALPGVRAATVQSYETRSASRRSLAALRSMSFCMPIELLSQSMLDSVRLRAPNEEAYWEALKNRYPDGNGIIVLSSIGYDPAGDVAVLSLQLYCGQLCGMGMNFVVRRSGDRWRIATMQPTWVS
jgi:hypothetical protein